MKKKVDSGKLDARQIKAATVLARAGYQRGSGKRSGAVMSAAQAAGVHRDSIRRWLLEPSFEAEIEAQRGALVQRLVGALEHAGISGNVAASIFLLKSLSPDVFDERLRLEKLRHRHALELVEARARAGLPEEDQIMRFELIVGEYGQPGFENVPEPHERH